MKIKHLGQICVGPTLSQKEIEKVREVLKQNIDLEQKIKLHSLLSGETRYKIIKLLNELKELCVCDMAEIMDMSVSAVSHQLKSLRKEKIVSTRRDGQTIYYSLQDRAISKLL
ncbi:transcriptional regulator [Candidatus Roizmanbacteria bacterium CG10_big_fil_rev_8_21_14_0_10_39_12]|uniref:Transcriptional regulator n=1 Tax=Candidatus Roizmanbacteria bacterium CG10_big_fil_rev_8_21_14_0_10_39_12 TaxID=1974852 RepID=A0A2M8KP05_9BACT|nr:MAG: transcriptional regulator [Candidatus Roizmanbacteria bacterium CG10_big_fil_rev_8_21_14_0_10_39_12]